jgi:hypothetical protein
MNPHTKIYRKLTDISFNMLLADVILMHEDVEANQNDPDFMLVYQELEAEAIYRKGFANYHLEKQKALAAFSTIRKSKS